MADDEVHRPVDEGHAERGQHRREAPRDLDAGDGHNTRDEILKQPAVALAE